jgi:hypothetical protein
VLNRYAEENNYATVLDSSAQNSPVLYASKNIDLTQDIIRLYDQAYPAKAAAPASKPAPSAPKPPATPPATKPQWVFVDPIGESTASVACGRGIMETKHPFAGSMERALECGKNGRTEIKNGAPD